MILNTTNIVIEQANDLNYHKLAEKYLLIKYPVPSSFTSLRRNSQYAFARFHNAYKSQLDYPYYFWSWQLGLYVLFPINEKPQRLSLDFLNTSVEPEHMSFEQIPLHVLLKLLVADYFYNKIEQRDRICQSKFFVFGKGRGKILTTVQLELRHDYTNSSSDGSKEFFLIPQARTLIKQDKKHTNADYVDYAIYYEQVIKDELIYYRQVKSDKVREWKNTNTGYDLFAEPDKAARQNMNLGKAQLPWHKEKGYEETRGFIAYKFQENFCKYLAQEYGIQTRPKQQEFKIIQPLAFSKIDGFSKTGLPVQELKVVYILDNRLIDKETGQTFNRQPLSKLIALLNNEYSNSLKVKFVELPEDQITDDEDVLVIQDYQKHDFKVNDEDEPVGFLAQNGYRDDPKVKLYVAHKNTVKQSISFNLNGRPSKNADWKTYFDYKLELSETIKNKLLVCFNELYLKRLTMKDIQPSPGFSLYFINKVKIDQYMFLYNQTLLYIRDKRFYFIDVAKDKNLLHNKLTQYDVQYRELVQTFKKKYQYDEKTDEELEEKLSTTHFILGQGTIVEIEDTEERLLVNYKQIEKQQFSNRSKKVVAGAQGVSLSKDGGSYAVGSVEAAKPALPRASKMRRLDFYKGDSKNHKSNIAKMLTVQFVRNKQYTVYPYPFDLIRLFNESIKH